MEPEGSSKNSSLPFRTPFTIKGCQFKTTFEKGFDAYWMKDGLRYKKADIFRTREKDTFGFRDLQFKQLAANDNGTYRCALNVSGSPLQLSTTVDIVLEGAAA